MISLGIIMCLTGISFTQESTNQKLEEMQISYGNDDDDDDPTSNIRLLTDSSENVVLERKVRSMQVTSKRKL